MSDEIDFAAWRTFEHTGWERAADAYDDAIGPVTRQVAEPLLAAAHVNSGMHVLDVATGPGYAAAAAAALGASVIGVDFSERMIERAWWRYPHIQFRKADAEALPFSDDCFDVVVSNFGLLHFGNPEQALAEAHRVLHVGGRIAFTVWTLEDPTVGFGFLSGVVKELGVTDVAMPTGVPPEKFSDPDLCKETLEALCFVDVESKVVTPVWKMDDPGDAYAALSTGAVRAAAIFKAQPVDALEKIQKRYREVISSFANGETYDLPMPVMLTAATKR